MTTLQAMAWAALGMILVIIITQGLIVNAYVRLIRRANPGSIVSAATSARAAIVLAVRGVDPQLPAVLAGLLAQDHPDYSVFIVVDSLADPAWPVVNEILQQASGSPARVAVLQKRLATCSLKCSALAEAMEALPADVDIVAFVDADTLPHRSWLRDLAARLDAPRAGAVNGNRWYFPMQDSHGSLVRHYWNAGAVVQVWFNGIPWAGSMALRRRTIDATGLVASWRRSLSVDGAVGRNMRAAGLTVEFVPEVMMANREHVTRQAFTSWLVRQLVAARSSGSGWPVVVLHACLIIFCVVVPPVLLGCGWLSGDGSVVIVAAVAGIAYWSACLGFTTAIDREVRAVVGRQGQPLPPCSFRVGDVWRHLAAVVDAHVIQLAALVGAASCSTVRWRGVDYEIRGAEDVRMINDRDFAPAALDAGTSIT
jgi:hypothetical protein